MIRHHLSLAAAIALIAFAGTAHAQNLTQADFTGVIVPQYCGSGTTTRLPCMFRATVTSLTASTTYRFFTQASLTTDFGGTNPGAGNSMLVSPDGATFIYTTGPSLTTAGNYGSFTTDGAGTYTGWFGFVNTGNSRFTGGNTVHPSIVIGDNAGVLLERRALDLGISVLAFGAAAGNGTGIWGASNAPGKDFVALFDNVAGTGRPLAVTFVESAGVSIASVVAYYSTSVSGQAGRWGTIVPNTLAGGVQRVGQFSAAGGLSVTANTDADGIWPSGANTVNPTGGTSAIELTVGDAPLPVTMSAFMVE